MLDRLDLDVYRGEILGFVGGSGAGKSVLLRTIIGLVPKRAGRIEVFGVDLTQASEEQRRAIERRWGVLFQQGALFSSLTVRQNVQFPMREYLDLSERLLDEVAVAKLEMVGLSADVCDKYPSELSGGMTKRVALARALALDPEIVFLDEPTSGLDPISAGEFDNLIRTLQQTLGLTVFMVTHDLDSLHTVCDRIAVLADGKVIVGGPDGDDAGVRASVAESVFPRYANASEQGPRVRKPPRHLMETRANYVLIGVFTLAVIAAGFGFVYWFHRGGGRRANELSGGVRGAGVGPADRCGRAVQRHPGRRGRRSRTRSERSAPSGCNHRRRQECPVRADTRVGVEFQGLTGIAALALRGGSQTAPALAPTDGRMPVLQAEVGTTQDVMQSGREVLRRVDEILIENQQAIRNSIKNIETFSAAMARNSERVDRILEGAETMINGKDGKGGDIQQAAQSVKQLADNLDKRAGEAVDSVKKLADNLDARTAEITVGVTRFTNNGLRNWEQFAVDGRRAANEFERAVRNFQRNPSRVIWGGALNESGEASATTTPRRRAR